MTRADHNVQIAQVKTTWAPNLKPSPYNNWEQTRIMGSPKKLETYKGIFDADQDDGEDDAFEDFNPGKELVVYLIDSGLSMLQKFQTEDAAKETPGTTFLQVVLECVVEDLKSRVISRDKDNVSVVFFNSRLKKNPLERAEVYVLSELQVPSAQLIQDLRSLAKTSFEERIGSGRGVVRESPENPLYNALWVCQVLLKGNHGPNAMKRVLLFTNTDDPFAKTDALSSADMRRTTLQRARDAQDLGIDLDLYPLQSADSGGFDLGLFYQEMVQSEGLEAGEGFRASAATKLADLRNQVKKRTFRKRMVRKVRFSLDDGRTVLSLKSYAMIRPARIAKDVYVDARDNAPVKTQASYICQDTGAVLTPQTLKKARPYGSSLVLFSPEDLRSTKNVSSQDLQLLGFKDLSRLKDYHSLSPPTFLYPDDKSIKGSVCAFVALHRAMLDAKKMALACWSGVSMPKLVALLAQEEKMDLAGQLEPPGFQMLLLPYFEDIREVEKYHPSLQSPALTASEEQVRAAQQLIRKVHLNDFSVLDIRNPALQRHYALLEAIALEEESLPCPVDETLPDYDSMARPGVKDAVAAFRNLLAGQVQQRELAGEEPGIHKGPKRKARGGKDERAMEWEKLAQEGNLPSLTVEELRECLRGVGLPVAGRKQELVTRLLKSLGKKLPKVE